MCPRRRSRGTAGRGGLLRHLGARLNPCALIGSSPLAIRAKIVRNNILDRRIARDYGFQTCRRFAGPRQRLPSRRSAQSARGPGAAERLAGPYPAEVERIVDGDTLAVRVAIWLEQDLNVLVRIRGIDAPELRGRCDDETDRGREAATVALEAAGHRWRGCADGDRGRQIFRPRRRRCRDAGRARMSAPRSSPAATPAPTTAASGNPGAEAISAASNFRTISPRFLRAP